MKLIKDHFNKDKIDVNKIISITGDNAYENTGF